MVEGTAVWEAKLGEFSLPVSEFRDAVQVFHTHFLATMEDRVIAARQDWSRPDVKLDLNQLEKEQYDRATWLDRVFHSASREHDWEEVRLAISRMEKEIRQTDEN